MKTKKHKFGKKNYRPKHKKLRLRKNIKGFRRREYNQIRYATLICEYYIPSKYLAER